MTSTLPRINHKFPLNTGSERWGERQKATEEWCRSRGGRGRDCNAINDNWWQDVGRGYAGVFTVRYQSSSSCWEGSERNGDREKDKIRDVLLSRVFAAPLIPWPCQIDYTSFLLLFTISYLQAQFQRWHVNAWLRTRIAILLY